MFTSTKWRASLISQSRYTDVPEAGTAEMEKWLVAQHSGRNFIAHVWDCPKCNPNHLPPESLNSRACSIGEALFGKFLAQADELGLHKRKSVAKSRVHKASVKDSYTQSSTADRGHLLTALCPPTNGQKRPF